jgi:phosphatidylinositol 3-kinase
MFESIPTYKILMLSHELGIIEFVENSKTLNQINTELYSLQNYVLEHNKNTTLKKIKERFIKSLAISSCISYILGLGDRHLDNIMINKKGQLFHIDYGYIMENPITNIFGAPVIRVTSEMIDFLGGPNSTYYGEFKSFVTAVFDIVRLYNNIILNYYYILGYEKIVNWNDFKDKISNRFLNGMSCKDVEISLIEQIEISSNSYAASFIDYCHHYSGKINIFT